MQFSRSTAVCLSGLDLTPWQLHSTCNALHVVLIAVHQAHDIFWSVSGQLTACDERDLLVGPTVQQQSVSRAEV